MVPALHAAPAAHTSPAAGAPSVPKGDGAPAVPFGAFLEDAAAGRDAASPEPADEAVVPDSDALPLAGSDEAVLRVDHMIARSLGGVQTGGVARAMIPPAVAAPDTLGKAPQTAANAASADPKQSSAAIPVRGQPDGIALSASTVAHGNAAVAEAVGAARPSVAGMAQNAGQLTSPPLGTTQAAHTTEVGAGKAPIDEAQLQPRAASSGKDALPLAQPTAGHLSLERAATDPQAGTRRNAVAEPVGRNGPHERPAERPLGVAAVTPAHVAPIKAAYPSKEQGDASLRGSEAAIGLGVTSGERAGVQASAPQTPAAHTPSPEVARHAAGQMAVAIAQTAGQTTEIALSPEELGRVRMTLSAMDNSVTLTVLADRPETMDLLRRHIDILAQEFRDLGYADINFSFGEGQDQKNLAPQDGIDPVAVADAAEDTTTATTDHRNTGQKTPSGGLDLRL